MKRKGSKTAKLEGGTRDSNRHKVSAHVWLEAEMYYDIRDTAAARGVSFSEELRHRLKITDKIHAPRG